MNIVPFGVRRVVGNLSAVLHTNDLQVLNCTKRNRPNASSSSSKFESHVETCTFYARSAALSNAHDRAAKVNHAHASEIRVVDYQHELPSS